MFFIFFLFYKLVAKSHYNQVVFRNNNYILSLHPAQIENLFVFIIAQPQAISIFRGIREPGMGCLCWLFHFP